MKIGLLIFIGLLIIQAKWKTHWNFLMIGACWGGNPVPISVKVRPFIISLILSILLELLFSAMLFGIAVKSLAFMVIVEVIADILYLLICLAEKLFYKIRRSIRDSE